MENTSALTEIDFTNNMMRITDENDNTFEASLEGAWGDFSLSNAGHVRGVYNLSTSISPFKKIEVPGSTKFELPMKHIPVETRNSSGIREYNIVIAGVGGTGGYVARDLARFVYSLNTKAKDIKVNIHLYDDDTVEEKNLVRQNFIITDKGKYKADVIAKRYGSAFGVNIQSHVCKVDRDVLRSRLSGVNYRGEMPTNIIVGCVDNNEARRQIDMFVRNTENTYWIDSGNEKASGQVVLGYKNISSYYGSMERQNMNETNFAMPLVTHLYPEILDPSQDHVQDDGLSCAERAMVEDQNIFVNMTAAVHTTNFLRQIIMREPITVSTVEFNIKGLGKVTYLTEDYLGGIQ